MENGEMKFHRRKDLKFKAHQNANYLANNVVVEQHNGMFIPNTYLRNRNQPNLKSEERLNEFSSSQHSFLNLSRLILGWSPLDHCFPTAQGRQSTFQ